MDWNDVLNIRKAREMMHPNNTSDSPEPSKSRGINSPVLNDTEQLVFRMRAELIDYIVAHGLVDGLIWDGVIKKTENGKIVITAEMVNSLVDKLQFFKKEDVLKLLEIYLPENNYVQDENYVHTDNNFTDEEIARIDKAILDIIEIKEHEQECDEANRQKFEEIDGRLSGHDASLVTISSQIAVITSSTIRQQGEIDEIEKVVGNHLKDYEMHLQDFNDHLEEAAERFNGIGEEMNSFREDLTDLENREKVNEQNIASLIAADADINRHMREIDDNHRKLTASTILLAGEIHRVEDKVDKNERNNQREHEELRSSIQAESERAVEKESEIEEKISRLTASSIVTDVKVTALSEALAEETKRATDAENALGNRIDRVTASSLVISGQISEIEEAIKRESEERKASDDDIKSSVATMSSAMAVLSSSVLANSSKIESIKEVISSTGTEIGAINARLDAAEDSISANTTVIQDHADRINRLEELARGGATIYALSESPVRINLRDLLKRNSIEEDSEGYVKITMNVGNGMGDLSRLEIRFYYAVASILIEENAVREIGTVEGMLSKNDGIVYGTARTTDVNGEIELSCSVITDSDWTVISDTDINNDYIQVALEGLSSTILSLDGFGKISEVDDGFYFVTGWVSVEYYKKGINNDEIIILSGLLRKSLGNIHTLLLSGCGSLYGSTVTISKNTNGAEADVTAVVTSYADSCMIIDQSTDEFFKFRHENDIVYVKINNCELPENINNAIYRQMGSDEVATLGMKFILADSVSMEEIECYVQGTVISVQANDDTKGHLVGELTGADESVPDKTNKIISLNITMHGDNTGANTLMNVSAIVKSSISQGHDIIKSFEVFKIYTQYRPIRINKVGATASEQVISYLNNNFVFPSDHISVLYLMNLIVRFRIVDEKNNFVGNEAVSYPIGIVRVANVTSSTWHIVSSFSCRVDNYWLNINPIDVIGTRQTAIVYAESSFSGHISNNIIDFINSLALDVLILSNGGTSYSISEFKLDSIELYKIF